MPESGDDEKTKAAQGNGEVAPSITAAEVDDFGLQVKERRNERLAEVPGEVVTPSKKRTDPSESCVHERKEYFESLSSRKGSKTPDTAPDNDDEEEEFKDARSTPNPATPLPERVDVVEGASTAEPALKETTLEAKEPDRQDIASPGGSVVPELPTIDSKSKSKRVSGLDQANGGSGHTRGQSSRGSGISEWSHQQVIPTGDKVPEAEEDEWQTMPAYAPYDIYDDDNRLVAKEKEDSDDEDDAYAGLGGAGKGYTRVQLDEDAQSATSLDENTQYLFKEVNGGTGAGEIENEEQRDAVSQMQATKDLLTEGQRIAYVGMTRLILSEMLKQVDSTSLVATRGSKKECAMAAEAMKMWSQKMMLRLYAHMDISTAEQIMIEQLADHGVMPSDMTPTLMQNARVKNPMAGTSSDTASQRPGSSASKGHGQKSSISSSKGVASPSKIQEVEDDEEAAAPPPPYKEHEGDDLPEVRTPSQLPTTESLDIDLRWTVLCDLFLTLIADSVYDARSRTLLEKVGENMEVTWLEICKFEKRVTDALEMQQAAEKENWNEDEHKENRRKMALKKRYIMMGLATVGGSLVIGLSAGLLAPVIGAGLAAGFTTIGVAGTSGFLAGAGGAAIITSGAAASGGIIAVRAANRRTGAVKTFEYRPLHNNKRVNLIVTVSGWMTGKVDDVRLPYSTVDPIMGDIYSVLWEPEMLTSMGDTINILATEALTQGLQQVLGSTVLIGLMAALQLPVVLTKLSYLIDNPWTVSLDRANSAGLILADSLIDRNLGTRPITFVGYSLGSRVIFSCLKELAKKGAYGLVQNVYLFGSPVVAKKDEYLKARSVVAGRFVNGFAKNDWILGYLFRLTSGGISRVAGLAPVEEIPGLENIDVTELVPGHMSYRTAMPRLLREVGWAVESDEFSEIEDPDPDNHQQRQRELINEIEEARKEFDKKEPKGKFAFFSRKKKNIVEKKEWETYEESKGDAEGGSRTEDRHGNNHGVLFDIDAIRAELASEHMEVRELKSTLPPMKLDLNASPSNSRNSLRATQSFDTATMLGAPAPNESKPLPRNPSSEYTPRGIPSPPIYGHEDEEVEMTFDTSYHSPPRSASTSNQHLPEREREMDFEDLPIRNLDLEREARPELKSSSSMPTRVSLPPQLPALDLGHNAWADDDEFETSGEKEIEMTFA